MKSQVLVVIIYMLSNNDFSNYLYHSVDTNGKQPEMMNKNLALFHSSYSHLIATLLLAYLL